MHWNLRCCGFLLCIECAQRRLLALALARDNMRTGWCERGRYSWQWVWFFHASISKHDVNRLDFLWEWWRKSTWDTCFLSWAVTHSYKSSTGSCTHLFYVFIYVIASWDGWWIVWVRCNEAWLKDMMLKVKCGCVSSWAWFGGLRVRAQN